MTRALFHLDMKAVSRRSRSVVSAAAYRSGEALYDERQDMTFDFTRKEGIVHNEIRAPLGTPDWMYDRQSLWNAAEAAETRRDAMTAREIEVALPRQLNRDQQIIALRGFVYNELTQRGLVADVAIHEAMDRDGNPQPHAHILFKDRPVDAERATGFAARKDRGFNRPADIERIREAWAQHANIALDDAGYAERVDHRRLDVQLAEAQQHHQRVREAAEADGRDPASDPDVLEAEAAVIELDRPPQPTVGVAAAAKARRAEPSERTEWRAAAERQARTVRDLAAEMRAAAARIRQRLAELLQAAEPAAEPEPEPQPAAEPAQAVEPEPEPDCDDSPAP